MENHPFFLVENHPFIVENHPFVVKTSLPTPMTGRVELLIYWRVLLGPDVDSEGTLGSTGDEHSGDFL